MSSLLNMKCTFCGKQVETPDNFAIDDNGDIMLACDECYKKIKDFEGGRK